MSDRRSFSIDEARRLCLINGLKLSKEKGTGRFEIARTVPAGFEPATWKELKDAMDERGLIITGSGTYLKVVKVSEGML